MTKELTAKDIKKLSQQELFPPHPEAGDLLVACHRGHYSASAIARAVEDADVGGPLARPLRLRRA